MEQWNEKTQLCEIEISSCINECIVVHNEARYHTVAAKTMLMPVFYEVATGGSTLAGTSSSLGGLLHPLLATPPLPPKGGYSLPCW